MLSLCLAMTLGFFGEAMARSSLAEALGRMSAHREAHSVDLVARERELSSLLQAQLQTYQGQRASSSVRFFLGKGSKEKASEASTEKASKASNQKSKGIQPGQPVLTLQANDTIPQQYWSVAASILDRAGMSTPLPQAAKINAPPQPPTPTPWERVLDGPAQPLDAKLGGEILHVMAGSVTPTPPPTQDSTDVQFVAQCPMVLFNNDLSIRAPSCNSTRGHWVDPSPLNQRTVLRWNPLEASGLHFGVDSALAGEGSALFADITQELTLDSYKFVMKNCLGVDRWIIEELIYKVDSMGKVSSTLDMHDVNQNAVAYFFRYTIRKPDGVQVAESTMFRLGTRQVNFTEVKDGISTGKLLATTNKQGTWDKEGWRECMSPISPRGWQIHFTDEWELGGKVPNKTSHATVATVQDLRVAMAGAITLMAHRDEKRAPDGINTEGSSEQMSMLAGGTALVIMLCILTVNCCQVFKGSGLRDGFKKTLFDTQGALLPKTPHQERVPVFHPTY